MVDFKDKPRLLIKDGQPLTTSLIIAEHFEKNHRDVLRAIRGLECSPGFRLRNFAQSNYLNKQGKLQPCYEITKDGFYNLVMGFTGMKAALWREAYIAAFNAMAQALHERAIAEASEEGNRVAQDAKELVAQINADTDAFVAEVRDAFRKRWAEVIEDERKRALAEVAQLRMVDIAGRLGVPDLGRLDGKGSIVSVLYLVLLFAVGESRPDATLLWLLIEAHDDCLFGHESVRITAAELQQESNGHLVSVDTVYKSRQRLIAAGFLIRTQPGFWRINREFLHERLCEIQAAAYLKKHPHPWLMVEENGVNETIQSFLDRLAAIPVPALTHRAPTVLQ